MKEPILSREQYETAEREYGYDRDTDIARRGFADGWEAAVALLEKLCGEPQWQYRVRTFGYQGDWHNCNPETAKRLQEKQYVEDHDVRVLYALNRSKA